MSSLPNPCDATPRPAVAAPSRSHRVQRIAHRAGNSRRAILAAVGAATDWIEVDVWYQYGRLVARHERGLWRLPLVYDGWRLRPHLRPLYLEEILQATAGGPRLFLDFKGTHPPLASTVIDVLRRNDAVERAAVCGQFWRPLDEIARLEPRVPAFYSLGRPEHVESFSLRLDAGLKAAGVSVASWLTTPDLAATLTGRGLEVFVWTVNQPSQAARFVEWGATGIISDRLDLLAGLP